MIYLFTGYDFSSTEIEAESHKDAIIKFAEYCGDDSELFMLAIKGCEDILDLMQMFNHFSTYTLVNVYEIAIKHSLDD